MTVCTHRFAAGVTWRILCLTPLIAPTEARAVTIAFEAAACKSEVEVSRTRFTDQAFPTMLVYL
jgi:hypothetical protein